MGNGATKKMADSTPNQNMNPKIAGSAKLTLLYIIVDLRKHCIFLLRGEWQVSYYILFTIAESAVSANALSNSIELKLHNIYSED